MRVAVVGMGVMGTNHARVLKSLGHDVIPVDPLPQRAPYAHLSEVCADVACISTPVDQLASQALIAMERGMDVLVEKPLALDAAAAEGVIEAAQSLDCALATGYTERHNPVVQALKDTLPSIGPLQELHIDRLGLPPQRPVPAVALDLATHDLDILRFLGLGPIECMGVMGDEHTLTANYALTQGTASLKASHRDTYKTRRIKVKGEQGNLYADLQEQTLMLLTDNHLERIPVDKQEPLCIQWQRFPEGATGEDGLHALRWAIQLMEQCAVDVAA
jgi:UDP-N-acetylglucosamine 3-dehydrogenase